MSVCPAVDPETGAVCMLTVDHTDHVAKVRWSTDPGADPDRLRVVTSYGRSPGFVAELVHDGLLIAPSFLRFEEVSDPTRFPITLEYRDSRCRW